MWAIRLDHRSVVVGSDLEAGEPMVDVGVTNEEVEAHAGTSGVEDVVGRRDDLNAVDEPLEDIAADGRLDHVPVLDAVLRTDQLPQRGEVPDLPVPAHDFRVSLIRLETPEEHLVAGADMGRDGAAQANFDLLEKLGCRVLAENRALRVLVLSPGACQNRGRIVIVPFGSGSLAARQVEVALLDPPPPYR